MSDIAAKRGALGSASALNQKFLCGILLLYKLVFIKLGTILVS